jgi:HlyD family secretion protein
LTLINATSFTPDIGNRDRIQGVLHMRPIKPRTMGLALGALGAGFHVTRVVLVELGLAQPHTLGSLSFPQTAAVMVVATALGGFLVGLVLAFAWNWFTKASTRQRIVWSAASVGAIALAGFSAWSLLLRPITVQIARIEHDVPVQVFGLGTVEARVQSKIGFKVSGVLAELQTDIGDRVAKGTVLARLNLQEESARVARAKAGVEQAEANLQRALATIEKTEANYTNARSINERRQKLAQTNVASTETAETAQAAERAALADVSLAKSDAAVAQAAISDAKAQLQQETATFAFHTLTSPYNAMVTARQKELGSALLAGETVFTIIDPNTVWVLAYIDESKAGEMAVGQPAEIVLRSQPRRRIAGHVGRIQPESDRVNEERRVEIAFDPIPEDFNLGEQAEVYITTVHLPQALLVPEAAIETVNKSSGTVWMVDDGHLIQNEVTLGHRLLDGRYEITSVPENATVLAQIRSGLRTGRAANISGAQKR